MTVDDVKAFLRANDARYLLAQFVDIHGAPKAKAVPVAHTDMVFGDGAGFAGFALWGFGMGPNGPDYMAVGDPDAVSMMPWMPGYARVACYGHVLGKPYEYCSRNVLKSALDGLAAEGLTLYTGIEPEFMLLRRDDDGKLGPADATDTLDKPCYDYKGLARATGFLDELTTALRGAGVDVYQIDHEDANGQFEVNFTYADAMRTADNFTFVKMAASEIARKHGMIATFMPKPFSNRTGTGSHFHLSIGNKTSGISSPIRRIAADLGLSPMAYCVRRGPARARARADGGVRAHRQFVQAAGGGTRAVGCHVGAGVHRLRRQQSHGLRAGDERPHRVPPARRLVQSLSRQRRDPRRRHGRRAPQARARRPPTTPTCMRHRARPSPRQASACCRRTWARRSPRSRPTRWCAARSAKALATRIRRCSSGWSGSNTRARSPRGKPIAISRCSEGGSPCAES